MRFFKTLMDKHVIKLSVILMMFYSQTLYCQQIEHEKLYHFVAKNFKIPESVKTDCNWNFAIVQLDVDKDNQVTAARVVNDFYSTDSLRKSFSFLKGYTFPKEAKIDGRAVIFPVIIDQGNYKLCKDHTPYRPAEIAMSVLYALEKAQKEHPGAIMIFNPRRSGIRAEIE